MQYYTWVNEQNSRNFNFLKKHEYPDNCKVHNRTQKRPRWNNINKQDVKRKEVWQDNKLLRTGGLRKQGRGYSYESDGNEDWKRYNKGRYCNCRNSNQKYSKSGQMREQYCNFCGLEHLNTVANYK